MSSDVGFITMGQAGTADEIEAIGVGVLGYAFMGKAHANGYKKLSYMAWPPPLMPRLISIAGRNEATVAEAARRYGFDRYVTDWRDLIGDPDVQLFDNSAPNDLEADDPFWKWWWPHGHVIGWEHTFVHELEHLLGAIAGRNSVAPHGATFEDGYRAAEVCDAVMRSAGTGTSVAIQYRAITSED